ncbi:MAG: hypothetical protein COW79_01890 [Bdellovibrionales bacterium CG22_combo_CG10-13_8_21_14_all_38_13]|nr:MAG: hypothetical protein COW79_01890 [Bdellovibrionales bacterium CG22_combo_CG10-13_8_21_14_all_38_13]
MGRTYKKRIGKSGIRNLNPEKIIGFIDQYLEYEEDKFVVEELYIKPTLPPVESNKEIYREFKQCFGKGESVRHAYLKWFALNYLKTRIQDLHEYDLRTEVNMYVPNDEYWEEMTLGDDRVSYGRILAPREEFLGTLSSYGGDKVGWVQEVDLCYIPKPVLFECGDTSPESLSLPLVTQGASRIFWLPFQNSEDKKKEWEDFETPLKAFEIKLVEG